MMGEYIASVVLAAFGLFMLLVILISNPVLIAILYGGIAVIGLFGFACRVTLFLYEGFRYKDWRW